MKSLDFEAQSTLSYALSNGILDLDRVHELCMASKREQAKALHPYSITPPSKDGERWRTLKRKPFRNCLRSGLRTRRRLPQAPTPSFGTDSISRST